MLDETNGPRERLAAMVSDAIYGRDYQDAVDYLIAEVAKDHEAMSLMLEPYQRQAARELIGITVRSQRKRIWNNASDSVSLGDNEAAHGNATVHTHPGNYRNSVAALSAGVIRSGLMDFRLHDGTPLADADKAKITDAAIHWGTKARDMAWKARWMERVAAKVPDGKTVRQSLDEAALADLKKETENV